ncbi:MAG: hypothetical protein ABI767_01755 [Rhodanobacter sp.]
MHDVTAGVTHAGGYHAATRSKRMERDRFRYRVSFALPLGEVLRYGNLLVAAVD